MHHSRSFYLLLLCLCMLLQHIDIDECADRNMSACSQVCVNSVGSYRCECEKGYFLEEDRKTCTKGERGESSLLSLQFPFCSRQMCVCVEGDMETDGGAVTRCSVLRVCPNRCSHESCSALISLAASEKTSRMAQTMTELVLAPHQKRGGGGVTSSHEFIFHYHILRNDSGVENPGCVFVLGYFWLICNIVGKLVHRYFHSSMKLVFDYSGDSSTADQSQLSALTARLSSARRQNSPSQDASKYYGILQPECIFNWMYVTRNPKNQSRSSM